MLADKAVAVDHLVPLLHPGATVFGATLLSGGVERNWYARALMARNNRVGIFANADDDLGGLRDALEPRLAGTTIATVGCVALFSGTTPS